MRTNTDKIKRFSNHLMVFAASPLITQH